MGKTVDCEKFSSFHTMGTEVVRGFTETERMNETDISTRKSHPDMHISDVCPMVGCIALVTPGEEHIHKTDVLTPEQHKG